MHVSRVPRRRHEAAQNFGDVWNTGRIWRGLVRRQARRAQAAVRRLMAVRWLAGAGGKRDRDGDRRAGHAKPDRALRRFARPFAAPTSR